MPEPTRTPADFLDRPSHQAVENLVARVYTDLYGPAAWHSRPAHLRASIVRFAIDQADAGVTNVLVHTERHGIPHHLPAATITAAIAAAPAREEVTTS